MKFIKCIESKERNDIFTIISKDIWNQAFQNTNTGSISKYTLGMHVIAYVRPLSHAVKNACLQKMCTITVEWTQALSTDWPLEKRFRSLDCICSG